MPMTLTVQTGNVAYNLNTAAIDTTALTAAFPSADMNYGFIAREFAGSADLFPYQNHKGIEPVRRSYGDDGPFIEHIFPPVMGEFVQ